VIPRRTVSAVATVSGVGLFSGRAATLTIRPAAARHGVVFRCVDLAGSPRIPADLEHVSTDAGHSCMPPGVAGRNTSIAAGDASVATIEHVMSALAGMGVTDVLLDIDGPEVPIGDGSAGMFVEAMAAAPLAGAGVEPVVLREAIRVEDGRGGVITASPSDAMSYSYLLEYRPHAELHGTASWGGDERGYVSQIAPARTFCLEHEADAMRKLGLFGHLTTREMLVLNTRGEAIDNTLRFPDEPARHKLLDLIGDLALLGRPLIARVEAEKSGHALTRELVRRLLGVSGGLPARGA